jgi:hypothetical protein
MLLLGLIADEGRPAKDGTSRSALSAAARS